MISVMGVINDDAQGYSYRLDFFNQSEPMPHFKSEGYFKTRIEAVRAAESVVKKRYHPVVKIEWE